MAAIRGDLSVESIQRVGHEILVAEGLGAISMRRIADAAGVWPTAVYHYVGSKDGLMQLVLDAVLGEVDVPDAELAWDAWLRSFAEATREVLLAHPGVATHLAEHGNSSASSLAVTDRAVGVLRRDGFSDHDAAVLYINFFAFVLARVRREEDLRDTTSEQVRQFTAAVDREPGLENLRAVGHVWRDLPALCYLTEGVEVFIAGAAPLRRTPR